MVRAPLFRGRPRREEAVQGDLGDCGAVAVMGAVAGHRPEVLTALLSERDDGTVEVGFHEARCTAGGAEPTGNRLWLLVTAKLPVRPEFPFVAAFADTLGPGVTWPAILEKALAGIDLGRPGRRGSGYARLDVGVDAGERAEMLTQITGCPADVREFGTGRRAAAWTEATLRGLLHARCPVLVQTRPAGRYADLPHRLHGSRTYEVTAIRDSAVVLRHPWGGDHPAPVPIRDLPGTLLPSYTSLRPGRGPR